MNIFSKTKINQNLLRSEITNQINFVLAVNPISEQKNHDSDRKMKKKTKKGNERRKIPKKTNSRLKENNHF